MPNKLLKKSLVQYYRWLRHYGLNDSHSGNASVRDGKIIWVTPSGACADTIKVDDLIECNIDGTIGTGASLDAPLHVQTYQRNPTTRAVLHSHNPHTLALTLNGKDFIPIDFEGALYFESIPVLTIPYEQYTELAPTKVSTCLENNKACVVRGHGIYVSGEDLNLAYKWICSLEHSAKIASIAVSVNKP